MNCHCGLSYLSIRVKNFSYIEGGFTSSSTPPPLDIMDSMSPQNIIANPVTGAQYEQVLGVSPLTNVTFASRSFDGNTVLAFDSLGTPYSYNAGVLNALNSGSVVVKCNTNQLTITVQPYSGEIKVQ